MFTFSRKGRPAGPRQHLLDDRAGRGSRGIEMRPALLDLREGDGRNAEQEASIAAATVPEYSVSSPMLAPLLMPDSTRSGRCGSRPVSATCTQSDGVPFTTRKPCTCAGREHRQRPVSVSALDVPLAFCSGAITSMWPRPWQACTSAAMPGAGSRRRWRSGCAWDHCRDPSSRRDPPYHRRPRPTTLWRHACLAVRQPDGVDAAALARTAHAPSPARRGAHRHPCGEPELSRPADRQASTSSSRPCPSCRAASSPAWSRPWATASPT
jgi:hypothetical protein